MILIDEGVEEYVANSLVALTLQDFESLDLDNDIEIIDYMSDYPEREYLIHFNECWDETITVTEAELNEWFDYIKKIVNDDSKSVWCRMQKIVDNITEE